MPDTFWEKLHYKSMDKSQNLGLWTKEKPFILDFDKL